MSSGEEEPAWRLVRSVLGVVVGLVVLFGVVIFKTWLATIASGLKSGDDPTTGYLVLNLLGSIVAAVLAGMVAAGVSRSLLGPGILAALLVATGIAAGGQAAQGQPVWYPVAVTVLGAAGVLVGAYVSPRGAVRRSG